MVSHRHHLGVRPRTDHNRFPCIDCKQRGHAVERKSRIRMLIDADRRRRLSRPTHLLALARLDQTSAPFEQLHLHDHIFTPQ